jgi:hypothetical protein
MTATVKKPNCKCEYCEKPAHAYLVRGKDMTPVCKLHDPDLILRIFK